jgi:hypothetical protein
MFEGYYAEQVMRDRERETLRTPAWRDGDRGRIPGEERAVLTADWSGWRLRRVGAVLGAVGMALVVSVALPASLQGLAWGLREILVLMTR